MYGEWQVKPFKEKKHALKFLKAVKEEGYDVSLNYVNRVWLAMGKKVKRK